MSNRTWRSQTFGSRLADGASAGESYRGDDAVWTTSIWRSVRPLIGMTAQRCGLRRPPCMRPLAHLIRRQRVAPVAARMLGFSGHA